MKQEYEDKQIRSTCCKSSVHYEKGSYMGSGHRVCNYCRKPCETEEITVKKSRIVKGGHGLLDTQT